MESFNKQNGSGINSSKVYCKFFFVVFFVILLNGINSSKVYCKYIGVGTWGGLTPVLIVAKCIL